MSYSIYLWQQLFFYGPSTNRLPALGWLQAWPWNVLALAACATASHLLIEAPLTRLGRRLADRRRKAEPVAEPAVIAYRLTPGRRGTSRTRPVPRPSVNPAAGKAGRP
jgi:peptidoglycan/LPS O-acetylase OafA/YrhL